MADYLILGSGLAGLSASYHLGHDQCLILEKHLHNFAHLHTEFREGFTWDQGPHVSFTKNDYVRELFANNTGGEYEEYEVKTANYFKGHWIDHPAQSNLYQVPEPLRSQCLESFLKTRQNTAENQKASELTNYQDWLDQAFGPVFSQTFPAAYTRKYWTREPRDLTTDWVGRRVFNPKEEDVVQGALAALTRQTHYITHVRYPKKGGYQSFVSKLAQGANIHNGAEVVKIDLSERRVWTAAGVCYSYDKLINTLPLPVFINLCTNVPEEVRQAASRLSCTQLLLLNVTAPHPTLRPDNWMYVYDEDKFTTRINCTEKLSPFNAPPGQTGVQVEVYFSRHRPLTRPTEEISSLVVQELKEMGLLDVDAVAAGKVHAHNRYAPWANVIFDHDTKPALSEIYSWLETQGLIREDDDLEPLTNWNEKEKRKAGRLLMAGRFGQWKYYWTDDCVLRGKRMKMMACV
jgi:protoporphyrinogen oxidase